MEEHQGEKITSYSPDNLPVKEHQTYGITHNKLMQCESLHFAFLIHGQSVVLTCYQQFENCLQNPSNHAAVWKRRRLWEHFKQLTQSELIVQDTEVKQYRTSNNDLFSLTSCLPNPLESCQRSQVENNHWEPNQDINVSARKWRIS